MGAVGADRKLELEERFVRGDAAGIPAAPQLPADLGKLARPERQDHRLPGVALGSVVGVVGGLDPRAGEPALGELVLAGEEPPAGGLLSSELLGLVAAAAKELAPQRGRPVVARAQRLPAQGEVDRLELRPAPRLVRRRGVGSRPVREAEVEVGRLRKVLEETVVAVVRDVASIP